MVDADTVIEWMDLAIADAGNEKLTRKGGVLRFGDDLRWDANVDDRGRWYAHYVCQIPEHQYTPLHPFWSKHVKLYTEPTLRDHVVKAIAEFTRT